MPLSLFAVLPLADASPGATPSQSAAVSPLPGENDSTWLGPGFLGFISLVFLAVAVFFIYRSMTKQLKRVTFDEAAVNGDADGVDAVGPADATTAGVDLTPADHPTGDRPSAT